MRLAFLLIGLTVFFGAAPVMAGQCQDDVTKIDQALKDLELPKDIREQAEDMRSQAVQLCGAGNEDEGVAVTSETKALLGID